MSLLAYIGWKTFDRIRIGPLAISPHGIGIAAGYLLGAWWMLREGPKRGMDKDHIGTILLWALIGAILGARVFYVLGHLSEFESFTDMLAIWRGGITFIGGIMGAIIAAYPWMRRYGYRFAQVMDSAAIGLAFGTVIGRIGDLIIGDHLGKKTDFFLGWQYKGGVLPGYDCLGSGTESVCRTTLPNGRPFAIGYGDVVHQTALYDFFIALFLFLFLVWLNRKPRREGVLIAAFTLWYGTGRVITDFLRVDKTWFGLTGSQWTSLAAMAVAAGALIRFAMQSRRTAALPSAAGSGPAPAPAGAPAPPGGPAPPEGPAPGPAPEPPAPQPPPQQPAPTPRPEPPAPEGPPESPAQPGSTGSSPTGTREGSPEEPETG